MKKIILYICIITGLISGCNKVEDPRLTDPDVRLAAELTKNESLLVNATYGWKAQIYPIGGKGFTFYLSFTADGKVKMLSDFSDETATVIKESTWRLKALQRPTLIFDTYTYIHLLADPTASISGGATGTGLKSDFEFAFTTTENTGDSLKLEGTYNGNTMVFVKASQAEQQKYLAGGLKTAKDAYTLYSSTNRFPYIQFDDATKIATTIDPLLKTISFAYVDATNKLISLNAKFAFTVNGLAISEPFTYNGNTFNEIFYDGVNKIYYLMIGTKRYDLKNSSFPLIPMPFLFGFAKPYTKITYNLASGLPSGIVSSYNTTYNSAASLFVSSGRRIDYTVLQFTTPNEITFSIYYLSGTSPFTAAISFPVTDDGNGILTLGTPIKNGNWVTRATQVKPFEDYFLATGRKFKLEWVPNTNTTSSALLGGLYPQDTPGAFLYGVVN